MFTNAQGNRPFATDLQLSPTLVSMGGVSTSPASAPGGGQGKTAQSGRPSVGDLQASLVVATGGLSAAPAPAPADGPGRTTADSAPGDHSGDAFSFSGFGSASEAAPNWGGGNRSGGAPTPEVNAGLGLLLAGLAVVVLRRRRRRDRQPARSA